jgi:hypothetical protein
VSSGPASDGLFDSRDTVIILLPGAALLFLAAIVRFTERRSLGALGRPHSFEAEPDLVTNWYSNLPDEYNRSPALPSESQMRRTTRSYRAAQAVVAILALALVMNLLVGGFAAFSAAKFTERYGPRTTTLLATLQRINSDDPIGTARAEWSRYLPSRDATPSAVATGWLASLLAGPDDSSGLGDFTVALWRLFQDDLAFLSVFDRAQRGAIPADTLALLALVAAHPRTLQLRRIARSPAIEFVAALPGDSGQEAGNLPHSAVHTRRVIDAARANALGAVLDVALQRPDSAFARLGENAAVGEHLLHVPDMLLNQAALSLLRDQTLRPLASLERTRDQIERSARLGNVAQQIQIGGGLAGMAGLAVDPADLDRFSAALSNPRIPLGYRLRWLSEGWAGLCAHPREIVLGPSRERNVALRSLADAIEDQGYASEVARRTEAMWSHPVTSVVPGGEGASLLSRLSEPVILGAFHRLVLCAGPDELR